MKSSTLKLLALLGIASAASAATPYVGANVGYLVDSQDPLFTTRVGAEFAKQDKLTHSAELEIGFLRDSEYGVDLDVVPVMANYRLGIGLSQKVSLELGAGVGMSFTKLKYYGSSNDTAFTYQGLVGVNFALTEKTSLGLGARYLNIGETTLHGITDDLGDDLSIELGLKFKF